MSQDSGDNLFEELRRKAIDMVTPIDFDALISAGILEKKGAWYQIHNWNELPEHARVKISTIRAGEPVLVKFRTPSKKLAKFLKKEKIAK